MTGGANDRGNGIGFLGVGPEKTGTTWLHAILATHPELRTPHVKELSYFWQDLEYPRETVFDRLTRSNWHHKRYRKYAIGRFKDALRFPRYTYRNRADAAWDMKYLLKTHTDAWYLSLFDYSPDTIAGEVSPQYFFLDQKTVEKIYGLCPDAKIIITLREPRAWIWSWVRMIVKKQGLDVMGREVEEFVDEKIALASFADALETWRNVYPEDQVEVFFYEDLCDQPWDLYCSICEFLGIEPEAAARDRVRKRFNAGIPVDIPVHIRKRIEDGWREDVRKLETILGRLPEAWQAQSETN